MGGSRGSTLSLVIFATFPPIWTLQGEVSEDLPTQPRSPCPGRIGTRGARGTSFPDSSPSRKLLFGVPKDSEDRFTSSF